MPYNISELVRKTVNKFTIEFYERENGDIPVEEFLISLDKKMRAKILGIMGILQEKGNLLREPYSKHLDDGIFEIRGKVGTDISRVLYFFYYEGKIIFTNGFIKKTQKTSKSEIEKAKMYRNNYLERRCENNEKI
ncbi:MAG TPA: type II toxin-antitoxin system RelE/ParE family toxin [Clostridiales bacterium]|nr:type II toxin-antitoxin system RelE/ParE family toxin [Clostridiales bacterium]